ncbi:ABC transporter ATP-binding protein [Luteitalea sp.]|uniref:ABC transporter ATP-binding protein n=1 Tax=Luteitalea sp. TaxID=2004800 RepID=UPI0025BF57BE|nr:ABC transporter ATP-binding protein [Luteitalea sp.]
MLTVQGLRKSYGGVQALRELSFTATPGRVIGLLGPNGSGKSTTINLLTGLMRPSAGTVCWHGVDIHQQLVAYQALLGYVPEEPRLYAYLTAVEYLTLVGGLRDLDGTVVARRVDRFLELFGLETDRYSPLSSFSKGMRQKVLISAALLHDPQVVILDEPDSGLDVASTLMLRSAVRTLAQAGKTVVYSSHVLDMVEKICTDVIILHHGTVVAQDSVARLRELSKAPSLEAVFATLAVDDNVDATGRAIAEVGTL